MLTFYVNVLSGYKEIILQRVRKSEISLQLSSSCHWLICWSNSVIITYPCIWLASMPVNIYPKHVFLHSPCNVKEMVKKNHYDSLTTVYLTYTSNTEFTLPVCLSLQIHYSTEYTSMPALLYSLHIKITFQNFKKHHSCGTTFVVVGHIRKSSCVMIPCRHSAVS